jgi:hypothetical protein
VTRWNEYKSPVRLIIEGVVGAIIDAYKDVELAPDETLSPKEAWLVGAGYTAEFTCRELWKRGIISREDAVAVFKATGGDLNDPMNWCSR